MEDGKSWHENLEGPLDVWRIQIRTWQESGLSQVEFCRQNNLKSYQFHYWKKRILGTPTPTGPLTFAELPLEKILQSPNRSPLSSLKLDLHSRYRIEIDRGFDPVTLLELIRVLDQTCSG